MFEHFLITDINSGAFDIQRDAWRKVIKFGMQLRNDVKLVGFCLQFTNCCTPQRRPAIKFPSAWLTFFFPTSLFANRQSGRFCGTNRANQNNTDLNVSFPSINYFHYSRERTFATHSAVVSTRTIWFVIQKNCFLPTRSIFVRTIATTKNDYCHKQTVPSNWQLVCLQRRTNWSLNNSG
jgi:hypothetical protein